MIEWSKIFDHRRGGDYSLAFTLTSVGITAVSTPFILYYMLLDGHKFSGFVAEKFPPKAQHSLRELLTDISKQIAKYIRGQLGVGLAVMIMFGIGYTGLFGSAFMGFCWR